MGFGAELLFLIALGLVVLGPKRLHSVLSYVARAKAEFEKATREIKSQVAAEVLQPASQDSKDPFPNPTG